MRKGLRQKRRQVLVILFQPAEVMQPVVSAVWLSTTDQSWFFFFKIDLFFFLSIVQHSDKKRKKKTGISSKDFGSSLGKLSKLWKLSSFTGTSIQNPFLMSIPSRTLFMSWILILNLFFSLRKSDTISFARNEAVKSDSHDFRDVLQMAVWWQTLILCCVLNCLVSSAPLSVLHSKYNNSFHLTRSTRNRVQQLEKKYVSA